MKIIGGYYIKARKIKESSIAHAPPHVREIWDYLLREANHAGKKKYGEVLKRGQILTTYDEIRESLHWMVGWRKHRYSKGQCEIAMKFLRRPSRKGSMITTRKTTRGMVITINNYCYYQDPKNYESYNESDKESHNRTRHSSQTHDTIDNNEKNDKKKEYKKKNIKKKKNCEKDTPSPPDPPKWGNGSVLKTYDYPDWLDRELWGDFHRMRTRIKKPITTKHTITGLINKLAGLIDQGYQQDIVIQTAIDNCWMSFYPPKNITMQETNKPINPQTV